MSVNKCILIGFVGKDPETRAFQDGSGVTNFSLATSEKYKDKRSYANRRRKVVGLFGIL